MNWENVVWLFVCSLMQLFFVLSSSVHLNFNKTAEDSPKQLRGRECLPTTLLFLLLFAPSMKYQKSLWRFMMVSLSQTSAPKSQTGKNS